MNYHFNLTGADRKALVSKISELLSTPATYKGMPSAAYQIGDYEVSKDGTLSWADEKQENSTALIQALEAAGFRSEEPVGLTVSVPLDKVNLDNLTNLLTAKGKLIRSALCIDSLPVETTDTTVSFPWFSAMPEPDEVDAYSRLICALCKMSLEQKRISPKATEPENEKYAFRCFLLRLGFIGDEYKAARRILLRALSGNSAWKGGEGHSLGK